MSKQILPAELAKIVTELLTKPEKLGELYTAESHQNFMLSIGEVVALHCGGIINGVNSPVGDSTAADAGDEESQPMLSVSPDERLPSLTQNVWAAYDPQGWADEIAAEAADA